LRCRPTAAAVVLTAVDAAGVNRLWLRPLDALTSEPLAGTEDARYPFWSPDGRSIGFFAERKLKIVDVTTRVVRVLCDGGRGWRWYVECRRRDRLRPGFGSVVSLRIDARCRVGR
jgi:hypothetical protein